jgi:NAD(P)-dependent dehydrogenase (short-subunit alcohol dehydrogenase family)
VFESVSPEAGMTTGGRLVGKRAIITGAASGIGRATAIRFAREGAQVALVDRNLTGLDAVAADIEAAGERAIAIAADVSVEAQVEAAIAEAVAAFGGLDSVIGVAGIELYAAGDARVHELDLAVWQRTLDTNLTGMFFTVKHGIRALLANGGGSVVVTGSATGLRGFAAGETAYSASKSGIHALARVAANDYARDGIRVNIVVPGFVDTPMNHPFLDDPEAVEQALQVIPMRRPAQPEEIAGIYVWLCTDDAKYATGGFYMVDGGQTAV